MGITALTLDEEWTYVSKFDQGEDKTIWKLGVIDAALLATIEDSMYEFSVPRNEEGTVDDDSPASTKLSIKQRNLAVVRHGLRGFENFKFTDGTEAKFQACSKVRAGHNVKVVEMATINQIPPKIIDELANEILERNSLTGDEAKNSD